MATRKVLDRLPISLSSVIFQHTNISQGRENDNFDTDAKAFQEKEEAEGTLVTSTDLCGEPWSLWI
jgi:hypothetical protein